MPLDFSRFEEFRLAGAPSPAALARLEERLGDRLPAEHLAFLRAHDGGEGFVGESYLRLFGVQELLDGPPDEQEYFAGWLPFASSGGGEAFVFDEAGQVLMVPWIGDRADAIPQGDLATFVERLRTGSLFDRP